MSLVINSGLPLAAGAGGTVSVSPVLTIIGAPPPATRGQPYSWSPTITGVQGNIRATLDGGLPNGLALNSATGAISGTPITEQTANFGLIIRDDLNVAFLPGLTLTVNPSSSIPPGFELVTTLNGSEPVTSGGEAVYAKAA